MSTPDRLSLRELARRLGRDPSGLGRLARKGVIPKGKDGTFDEAAVRRAMAENLDPGRRKEAVDGLRSAPVRSTAHARPQVGAGPTPDAYRARPDLPDAFAQGALFGAHLVAFGIPTVVGSAAVEAGLGRELGLALYDAARTDAHFLVGGVCEELGLIRPDAELPAAYEPASFQGFDSRPLALKAAA